MHFSVLKILHNSLHKWLFLISVQQPSMADGGVRRCARRLRVTCRLSGHTNGLKGFPLDAFFIFKVKASTVEAGSSLFKQATQLHAWSDALNVARYWWRWCRISTGVGRKARSEVDVTDLLLTCFVSFIILRIKVLLFYHNRQTTGTGFHAQ